MKYCLNCGHVLPDFAKFCPICGAKQLSNEEVNNVVQEEPVEEIKNDITPTIVEEPVVETPIEEPQEVETINEVVEEVTEDQPQEELDNSQTKSDKVAKKGEGFKKFLDFVLHKDIIKFSLIFLGSLFALSLLFWIIASFTKIFFFFKFDLFLLSAATLARMGFLMFKQIKENKFNDMFNLLLKGSITVMHLLLFILNFILMVI